MVDIFRGKYRRIREWWRGFLPNVSAPESPPMARTEGFPQM